MRRWSWGAETRALAAASVREKHVDIWNALGLVLAGLVAGIINTLAGGGSLLSVPLLVALGLPGDVANGTNRVGILAQSVIAAWRFRSEGVSGLSGALPVLAPVAVGALVGAIVISMLPAAAFEQLFGAVMLLLLWPTLKGGWGTADPAPRPWPPLVRSAVFFAIGIYGGAIQAGVGLILVLALARSGLDLVRANAIKVVVVGAFTAVAVPVFIVQQQVAWVPALALVIGFSAGGALGARIGVRGGERVIKPILAVAVVVLALRMLGLLDF
jgi:uncharacterized membrane protein YfcA